MDFFFFNEYKGKIGKQEKEENIKEFKQVLNRMRKEQMYDEHRNGITDYMSKIIFQST